MGKLKAIMNENTMEMFRHHLLFVSHPEDRQYLKLIKEILWKYNSEILALWYIDGSDVFNNKDEEEEYMSTLASVQMLVIPVTRKFLLEANNARTRDLAYAIAHRIPILPILMEANLAESFDAIVGSYQCIDLTQNDPTQHSITNKLGAFLAPFFRTQDYYSNEIKSIVKGSVFISYRKKNRADALKVIEMIRRDTAYHAIEIWYDEQLGIGEAYTAALADKISRCDLFIMVVTPDILEPGNYVYTHEFPQAKYLGKTILPIVTADTNLSMFERVYPDTEPCINISNKYGINNALYYLLKPYRIDDIDMLKARQKHFLGIAYLYGRCVEQNIERGLTYLSLAAQEGDSESIDDLADIYASGRLVPKNMERAILLQKQYLARLKKLAQGRLDMRIADGYYDLIKYLEEFKQWDAALFYRREQVEYLRLLSKEGTGEQFRADKYYAAMILMAEELLEMNKYDKAKEAALLGLENLERDNMDATALPLLASGYYISGVVVLKENNPAQAIKYFEAARYYSEEKGARGGLNEKDGIRYTKILAYLGELYGIYRIKAEEGKSILLHALKLCEYYCNNGRAEDVSYLINSCKQVLAAYYNIKN